MNDWFRSIGVFGTAFAAVVVITMGIVVAIVPAAGGEPQGDDASAGRDPATTAPPVAAPPGAVGGTLKVTGDREGSFVLARETIANRYGLTGPDGQLLFGGEPVSVVRVQYDGLEFFVDPGACTVVPGERHEASGVAQADVRCDSIQDVRGNGTISLEGRVGVAADLFGLRGDLPQSGGSVRLGEETLTFDGARLQPSFVGAGYVGQLIDEEQAAALSFSYDSATHALAIDDVQFGSDTVRIGAGTCAIAEREVGLLNPHTRVVELTIDCESIDIPALGRVPLEGSVIVEVVEPVR